MAGRAAQVKRRDLVVAIPAGFAIALIGYALLVGVLTIGH